MRQVFYCIYVLPCCEKILAAISAIGYIACMNTDKIIKTPLGQFWVDFEADLTWENRDRSTAYVIFNILRIEATASDADLTANKEVNAACLRVLEQQEADGVTNYCKELTDAYAEGEFIRRELVDGERVY